MKADARAVSGLLGLALCAVLAACGASSRIPARVGPAAPAPTAQASAPAQPATAQTSLPTQPAARQDPAATVLVAGLGASETVTLAFGETASLGADGASVSFERVVEDSRCPVNARCIWQGRVVVAGHVTVGGERVPYTLGSLGGFDDAPATLAAGPYSLSIADVEPYPDTPEGHPQEAYVLTLELGR